VYTVYTYKVLDNPKYNLTDLHLCAHARACVPSQTLRRLMPVTGTMVQALSHPVGRDPVGLCVFVYVHVCAFVCMCVSVP